jgi:ribosome biogenesis protein SSF1/2
LTPETFFLNVNREAVATESDCEDETKESTVTLGQNYVGRSNTESEQRAIKLIELGPRMELQLKKIQTGLGGGEVLYHEYITKTPKELEMQKRERELKMQKKALLRKQQEDNVKRKEALKKSTGDKRKAEDEEEDEEMPGDEDSDEQEHYIEEDDVSEFGSEEEVMSCEENDDESEDEE